MQSKYLVFVAFLGLAGCSSSDPNDDLDGDAGQSDADLTDTDLGDSLQSDNDAGDNGPGDSGPVGIECAPGTKACCRKYADDTLACQGTSIETCYGNNCADTTGGSHGAVKAVVRAYCGASGYLVEDGACPSCTTVPDTGNGGGNIAACHICDQQPTCATADGCLSPCD